ncbi:SAM-dependent methyltransferase [Micromonospora aurantiaca (nom. illeg.)]|uniref:SAM-dependent methyltransferase n=1 Tax=Micromonospora aurantiaca (nom. illeg.) TaxID=47850 RepID=UPI003F4A511C
MDRQRLSSIAHSHHPIAAPISGLNLNRLLRRAGRRPAARILDLGCGEGAWALQALAHYPDGHADGVDLSPYALERAAEAAAERGLADRLTLHERDARSYVPDGDYDLVLCVGSTHAFGGFGGALELAGRHVNPDGILMVGEGFWQVPPTPDALAALGANRTTTPTSPVWSTPPGRRAGPRCTRTSATPPSGTTTSGRGPVRSPSGRWTTPVTRTPPGR